MNLVRSIISCNKLKLIPAHIPKLHQGAKQSDAVYLFTTSGNAGCHNIQTETLPSYVVINKKTRP